MPTPTIDADPPRPAPVPVDAPADLAHGQRGWNVGDVDSQWLAVAEPAALEQLSRPGSEPSRREVGRFVAVVAATALVVVAAVSLFNYRVDATGEFGGRAVTERMDVRIKLDLIETWTAPPDVVVLGPSPMMKYDPRDIERITGQRAFNASLSGARPSASFAIASYLAEQHGDDMPELVIGLNNFAFRTGRDGFLRQDHRLRRQVDRGRPVERVPARRYLDLASMQLAITSARTLLSRADGPLGTAFEATAQADYRKVDERGYLLYDYPDDPVKVAQLTEEHVGNYSLALRRWIADGGAPDAAQVRYLERAIRVANQHGGRPIVVMTPLNPDVFERLRGQGLEAQEQRIIETLREMQRRVDFELVDLRRAERVGLTVDDFYDASHITPDAARRCIEAIHRATSVARSG